MTIVTGLDAHLPPGMTLKSVAKTMATRFACSASVGRCCLSPLSVFVRKCSNLQRLPLETLLV